jgi:hypothetical protein
VLDSCVEDCSVELFFNQFFLLLAAVNILQIVGPYCYHPDRKSDHSPPPSAKVTDEWCCTSPLACALDDPHTVTHIIINVIVAAAAS